MGVGPPGKYTKHCVKCIKGLGMGPYYMRFLKQIYLCAKKYNSHTMVDSARPPTLFTFAS